MGRWAGRSRPLAGLLGGDALGEGLESISPVFGFMVRYYLLIALGLIILSFVIKTAKNTEN